MALAACQLRPFSFWSPPRDQRHRLRVVAASLGFEIGFANETQGCSRSNVLGLTSRTPDSQLLWMNTQQRIDRLEDALTSLGTIIEAQGRWAKSENPTVRVFGEKFNDFVAVVAKERYNRP